ncbi:MAG: hypothetical protein V4697_03515 [Patescibacteria group bacterium]
MKVVFKISILALFFTFSSLLAHAQLPTSADSMTLTVNPENPAPGQSFRVTLQSYDLDLSGASIVWRVNGQIEAQGIGVGSVSLVAPKSGTALSIIINIKGANGREMEKRLTIKPSSVDLIWEPLGYAPPFFKGKGIFAYQNRIRIVAIPHILQSAGKEIDPKTLVYTWKKDGKYIDNASGYGRQAVEIQTEELPKPQKISVEISNREGTESAVGEIVLEPGKPSVAFYEEDLLYGTLFNTALGRRVDLKNKEMKIRAVPYDFNSSLTRDANSYVWSINNVEQPDLITNQSITIRTKGDTDGSSNINLNIRNEDFILQGADGFFSVFFSKKADEENESVF